jgi:ubiquinone/menaquinone biosynthesis C-methylase UbiE
MVMARGNAEQERGAIAYARLRRGEHVLVLGPGPGVGVELAAAAVGPSGHVVAVEPSATMRRMAGARCAAPINTGVVEVRDGAAEHTRSADSSIDAAISVNNVMPWDRSAGSAELARVLRPGGRLVLTVHRRVLGVPAWAAGTRRRLRRTGRHRSHRSTPAVQQPGGEPPRSIRERPGVGPTVMTDR